MGCGENHQLRRGLWTCFGRRSEMDCRLTRVWANVWPRASGTRLGEASTGALTVAVLSYGEVRTNCLLDEKPGHRVYWNDGVFDRCSIRFQHLSPTVSRTWSDILMGRGAWWSSRAIRRDRTSQKDSLPFAGKTATPVSSTPTVKRESPSSSADSGSSLRGFAQSGKAREWGTSTGEVSGRLSRSSLSRGDLAKVSHRYHQEVIRSATLTAQAHSVLSLNMSRLAFSRMASELRAARANGATLTGMVRRLSRFSSRDLVLRNSPMVAQE